MKNVICNDFIYLDMEFESQREIFQFLGKQMYSKNRVTQVQEIVEGFYQREKEFSTAMNDGIAIPHCRVSAIQDATVIIVRNKHTIRWTEDEEVDVFFVLLIPESNENQMHIKILAQVAQLIMEDSFIKVVRESDDKHAIYKEMKSLNEVLQKEVVK